MSLPHLGFVHWVSETPSGGNTYDAEVVNGLRRAGADIATVTLRGPIDAEAGRRISGALGADRLWLIDAILAVAMPEVIATAVNAGRSVSVLVHHFGTDDPDLTEDACRRLVEREAAALSAASGVLCTSSWAAAELARRYGVVGAAVAAPGVHPAPLAPGSGRTFGPRILSVGALTPTKDPLTLVAALSRVSDRVPDAPWSARLVGAAAAHPAYAATVRGLINDAGLAGRVTVSGPLTGARLEEEWAAADLLVHLSRSETYGLVVTEALARGIPAIVGAGTGAVEALDAGRGDTGPAAGTAVVPKDPDALAEVLRRWLGDADLRRRWRCAAVDQRDRLPTWSQTATAVLDHLLTTAAEGTDA